MILFFFQAEDGIRDFCLSRGLGDVYKRQVCAVRVLDDLLHSGVLVRRREEVVQQRFDHHSSLLCGSELGLRRARVRVAVVDDPVLYSRVASCGMEGYSAMRHLRPYSDDLDRQSSNDDLGFQYAGCG